MAYTTVSAAANPGGKPWCSGWLARAALDWISAPEAQRVQRGVSQKKAVPHSSFPAILTPRTREPRSLSNTENEWMKRICLGASHFGTGLIGLRERRTPGSCGARGSARAGSSPWSGGGTAGPPTLTAVFPPAGVRRGPHREPPGDWRGHPLTASSQVSPGDPESPSSPTYRHLRQTNLRFHLLNNIRYDRDAWGRRCD
jgi:hypothetical protein